MVNYYTKTLDFLNIERPKCKCCGEDIIYDNTDITNHKGNLKIKGKSYQTVKVIDGITYTLKVCQKCLLKHYPNIKNLSRIFNVMGEPTKFAFEIPDNIYYNKRNNYALTKEKMINKYGEEEGNKRWEKYCKRQSETNTFEYKQKTYGWTEEEFKKFNKSRAVTLKNLIKKYGEEEGNKKWMDFLINRSKGVSEISQRLFKELDNYLGKKYTTYYHDKNNEYFIHGKEQIYYMDYYIKELNICIEYNGGCFHGDERIYEDNEYCNPFDKSLTAKELREKDKERYEYLYKNHGIKTFVIWELDYNPNDFDYINYIKNTLKIDIND